MRWKVPDSSTAGTPTMASHDVRGSVRPMPCCGREPAWQPTIAQWLVKTSWMLSGTPKTGGGGSTSFSVQPAARAREKAASNAADVRERTAERMRDMTDLEAVVGAGATRGSKKAASAASAW